ncbi:MAG: TPM domain-containing protein [Microscillaceae bacterium]|nr:TPM domain-containing protein [Microscillaceae bacterium]
MKNKNSPYKPILFCTWFVVFVLAISPNIFGQSFMEYAQSGKRKYEKQDYKGAVADYDQAIKLSPQVAELYYRRGLAKYYLKDFQGAVVDYTQSISLNPNNPDAYFDRAYTKYNYLNDYEGALADYTQVIAQNPGYATAYNNRGLTKTNLKDYQGAIADYNLALQLQPDFPIALSNRGLAKYELKDYQGALDDLNAAFQGEKYNNAWAMNYRGLAKFQIGKTAEALQDFEKAAALDSTYGLYRYNIAYMKNELGDKQSACAEWQTALNLGYQDAQKKITEVCGGVLAASNYLYVRDEANMLSESEKQLLENKLKQYDDSTSTQIAIVIQTSLNGQNMESYTVQLAQTLGIGQKGKDNGLLIFVSKDDRKIRIEVGYGLEGVITDLESKYLIENYLTPYFKQQQFHKGFDQTIDAIIKLLSGEFKPDDIRQGKGTGTGWAGFWNTLWNILIILFAGGFILIVIIGIFSGGRGSGGGGTYSSSGSSWSSSSSSSWSSSSSSSSSWSSGGSSSFGGGSFGGGGASGSW